MGRPEQPVSASSKPLKELALWLRSQRGLAGLRYAQMATLTGLSAATLSRAASGKVVPTRRAVVAYTQACQGDVDKAAALWRAARRADPRTPQAQRPPHLELIEDFPQLRAAMVELRAKIGCPPLRELQRKAGRHGELPQSTLDRVLRGAAVPSKDLLRCFVQACRVPNSEETAWEAAWDRADRQRNQRVQTAYRQEQTRRRRPVFGEANRPEFGITASSSALRRGAAGDTAAVREQATADMLRLVDPAVLADRYDPVLDKDIAASWNVVREAAAHEKLVFAQRDAAQTRQQTAEITAVCQRDLAEQETAVRVAFREADACQRLLADRLRTLGADHPDTLATGRHLATRLRRARDAERAAVHQQQRLASAKEMLVKASAHHEDLARQAAVARQRLLAAQEAALGRRIMADQVRKIVHAPGEGREAERRMPGQVQQAAEEPEGGRKGS
jgi:transcriptional regulator with XRE-family HTH domain